MIPIAGDIVAADPGQPIARDRNRRPMSARSLHASQPPVSRHHVQTFRHRCSAPWLVDFRNRKVVRRLARPHPRRMWHGVVPALTVLSHRGQSLLCRSSHLCARRRLHAAFFAPHGQIGRESAGHLYPLRLDLCEPLHVTTVLTGELVDQFSRFAANQVKGFEHRVALLQPFSGVRFGGTEQTSDFSGNFFKTRCSSLSHADLQS